MNMLYTCAMGITSILLLLSSTLPMMQPRDAIREACRIEGCPPGFERELTSISRRESRHQAVGVHKIDQWASELAWRRAMRVGWLDERCAYHVKDHGGWAARGNFGLFAAYSLRYLDVLCVPAPIMDHPFIGATISIRKMKHVCKKYKACTEQERRWIWSGLSVFFSNKKLAEEQNNATL